METKFNLNKENGRIVLKADDIAAIKYKISEEHGVMNFYFVNNDGERYYFKMNSIHTLDKPEVLSGWLAEEFGLDAVQMHPAEFHENGKVVYGVLSKDYVKDRDNTEIFNAKRIISEHYGEAERINTLWHHLDSLKKWRKNINDAFEEEILFISPNTAKELKRQMLWYFLVVNQDAHATNIEYQLISDSKNRTKTIQLSPIFDSSYSFFMRSFHFKLRDNFNELSQEEKKSEVENGLESAYATFQVQERSKGKRGRGLIALEIAKLINVDEEFKEFYEKVKTVDIRKFLNLKVQQTNCKIIDSNDIELAALVIDGSIAALEKALEYEKMMTKGPLRFLSEPLNKEDFTI